MRLSTLIILAIIVAGPAVAGEREWCPDRPGLGTPACTIAPGRVSVETGLADWQTDSDGAMRTDTLLLGDTLVRVGLTDAIEAQLGWTPFGHVRTRDAGTVERANRVGDVLLGVKANLLHPDGDGVSIAVAPFATLPVGRSPVGAGDWGAGVVVPVTAELNDKLSVALTSEVDAAVDDDGSGRHLAYGATAGLDLALSKAVDATVELAATRDDDPSGGSTEIVAALSFAWKPVEDLQLDLGGSVGLNHAAPDAELYVGIARRF